LARWLPIAVASIAAFLILIAIVKSRHSSNRGGVEQRAVVAVNQEPSTGKEDRQTFVPPAPIRPANIDHREAKQPATADPPGRVKAAPRIIGNAPAPQVQPAPPMNSLVPPPIQSSPPIPPTAVATEPAVAITPSAVPELPVPFEQREIAKTQSFELQAK